MHVANSPHASQIEVCWRQLTVVKMFLCSPALLTVSTKVSSSTNSSFANKKKKLHIC